jgi:hypothetical protein
MKPTPSLPSELADLVPAAVNRLCAVVECGAVKASDVLAAWDQGLSEFLPLVNVRHRASSVPSELPLIS